MSILGSKSQSEPMRNQPGTAKKKSFRERIFLTTHQLLLFKAISPNFASLLMILKFIQFYGLTFNTNNLFLAKSVLSEVIDTVDYILVYPYLIKNPSATLHNVLLIFTFLVILINGGAILFFFFAKNILQDTKKRALASYAAFLFETSNKVLYMPLLGILMISFQCNADIRTCWGGKRSSFCID